MSSVNDFLGGRFLQRKDVPEPVIVTIVDHSEEIFPNDPRKKLILTLAEFEKPFVCNQVNGRALWEIFGTDDLQQWVGKKFVLYDDPTIMFQGKLVGGLRVRDLNDNEKKRIEERNALKADAKDAF